MLFDRLFCGSSSFICYACTCRFHSRMGIYVNECTMAATWLYVRSLSTAKHRSICRCCCCCCCSHALLLAIDISRAREPFVFYTEDCLLFAEYWRLPVVTITVFLLLLVLLLLCVVFFFLSFASFFCNSLNLLLYTLNFKSNMCERSRARSTLNHSIDLMKNLSSRLYCGKKSFACNKATTIDFLYSLFSTCSNTMQNNKQIHIESVRYSRHDLINWYEEKKRKKKNERKEIENV